MIKVFNIDEERVQFLYRLKGGDTIMVYFTPMTDKQTENVGVTKKEILRQNLSLSAHRQDENGKDEFDKEGKPIPMPYSVDDILEDVYNRSNIHFLFDFCCDLVGKYRVGKLKG